MLVGMKKPKKSYRPNKPNGKPTKPYADFPLFPHANGQWAKKILGHLHYFGTWDDPTAAVALYRAQADDLHAGREPVDAAASTIPRLADAFLSSKELLVTSHELSPLTYRNYARSCDSLARFFQDRPVASLRPDDFEQYRASLISAGQSLRSVGLAVNLARIFFSWCVDNDHLPTLPKYGTSFREPPRKLLRKLKYEAAPRIFTAAEIHSLLDAAEQPLRSMVLLGVNAGFGNHDCALVPLAAVRAAISSGWLSFPRPKSEVQRRCPLWPETIASLREWLAIRPTASTDTVCFLRTKRRHAIGRWIMFKNDDLSASQRDYIGKTFGRLRARVGVETARGNFYNLRHTFRTVADASRDTVACDVIMGHADATMGANYRANVADERLQAVTEVVHEWLYGCRIGCRDRSTGKKKRMK